MGQFLIVHRGALGDFLLTWPCLRAVRKALSKTKLVGIGRPEYMRLAKIVGLIDGYFDCESSALISLFSGLNIPPEIGEVSGAILWLAHGDKVVELLKKEAELPVVLIPPFTLVKGHVGGYYYQLISQFFPLEPVSALNPYFPLAVKKEARVVIHPGSGSPKKNYKPGFYLHLADELSSLGYLDIRFILGPTEREEGNPPYDPYNLVWPKDIKGLAYFLASSTLFIGNDSGVSHLAGILGTSTIAFYKTTNPKVWGVMGPEVTHIEAENEELAMKRIRAFLRPFAWLRK